MTATAIATESPSSQRWIDRLEELGREVAPDDQGAYLAQCPAHLPDNKPSLVITPIEGQILVHCRAGCSPDAVLAVLDFTRADYYDYGFGAKYVYTDERGTPQRTVHRTPDKDFTQKITPSRGRTKDGKRRTGKGRTDLYRLPKVIEAVKAGQVIYLVEGEKDVHALERFGCAATTAPMGASNFHLVDLAPLKGAKVWAIPDKDATGEKWAETVQERLQDYAAELVWLEPGKGCKDAADHVARFGSPSMELRDAPGAKTNGQRRLRITRASEITPKATEWLWQDEHGCWLAKASVSLLGGRESVGKSTICYGITAQITQGNLPGAHFGTPKSVIVCATEDAWAQTIVPRLIAAGADLGRVLRVDSVSPEGFEGALMLPDDVEAVRKLAETEDAVLLFLDPLLSTVNVKLDTHKDSEVRTALGPVSRAAHETGLAVLGLIHENKSQASDLLNRIMASRAFVAVVRAVLYAARQLPKDLDSADPFTTAARPGESFVFGQLKNNLAANVPYALRYHIEGVAVGHDAELDKPIESSRIVWDGPEDGSVQDIVTEQENRNKSKRETGIDQAITWLRAYLTEHGPTPSKIVKDEGDLDEHSDRMLKRAAKRLGVVITPIPGTKNETTWSLPVPTDLTVLSDLTVPTVPTSGSQDSRDSRDSRGDTGKVVPTPQNVTVGAPEAVAS
jgi:hypothetical protein